MRESNGYDNVRYLPPTATGFPPATRHKPPRLRFRIPSESVAPIWSHEADWCDLVEELHIEPSRELPQGWPALWTATYRHGATELSASVADVSLSDLVNADPVLRNSWHRGKTSRAGVRHIHATGLRNAHASMFERDLLMMCDFLGATAIASQPFKLFYEVDGVRRHHTPDFLAVIDGVVRVVDCRPRSTVDVSLLERAGALAAACLSRGWSMSLVVGYPHPALATLDAISAHATVDDAYGFTEEIFDVLERRGPQTFEELSASFRAEPVARAVIQALLWSRELSIDLASALEDESLVLLPEHVGTDT